MEFDWDAEKANPKYSYAALIGNPLNAAIRFGSISLLSFYIYFCDL